MRNLLFRVERFFTHVDLFVEVHKDEPWMPWLGVGFCLLGIGAGVGAGELIRFLIG